MMPGRLKKNLVIPGLGKYAISETKMLFQAPATTYQQPRQPRFGPNALQMIKKDQFFNFSVRHGFSQRLRKQETVTVEGDD
jgi:hypothetical protein